MRDDINAFAEVFRMDGASSGLLAGASFAAKDLFDVDGYVTGCGNPEWARTHDRATTTAWAVDAMLQSGATLLGKTHTDELAYSLLGTNAHYGTPTNSVDPRRVPGGSSSGSAASVAAGLVDIALGTDTGGSVRMPASFCGVWGLRTTFGQISVSGVMPFTKSFDTVGWFARDPVRMAQTAEALGCVSGDPVRRLLLPVDVWACADANVVSVLAPAVSTLQQHLGPITPVVLAPEGLTRWRDVFRICQAWEAWTLLGDWIANHDPNFGVGTKERFEMAASIGQQEFVAADRMRGEIANRMTGIVTGGAALVMPTSPTPAPFLDATADDLDAFRARALEMLCPAGLAGLPQLSVPVGVVEQGPVGLSLVGAADQDRALIELAHDSGIGVTQD